MRTFWFDVRVKTVLVLCWIVMRISGISKIINGFSEKLVQMNRDYIREEFGE